MTKLRRKKKSKIDTRINGKCNLVEILKRETNKVPLTITRGTTIYVDPENCNEEYAENYRKQHFITQ